MKKFLQQPCLKTALTACMGFALMIPVVNAEPESLRAANRQVKRGSRPPAGRVDVDVDRRPGRADVDVDVDRRPAGRVDVDVDHRPGRVDVDVDVDRRPVHVDVDVNHRHGGFWAGVGTAIIVGSVVKSIPPSRTVIVVSGTNYYYVDGIYYVQGPTGFVVATSPVGAIVTVVPRGSLVVTSGQATYHYFNGTYYLRKESAYVVVSPPLGVKVTVLPAGATRMVVNGVVHYQFGGIYYRPAFQNGVTVYTTVRL